MNPNGNSSTHLSNGGNGMGMSPDKHQAGGDGGGGYGQHGGHHGGGLHHDSPYSQHHSPTQVSKTNLYIRGLTANTTDKDLHNLCSP